MPPSPTAVVVLAAGEGTRMHSATPKVLHPIGGRSLLGHAVHAAAGTTPEHLVVVVGHEREQVGTHTFGLADELGREVLTAVQDRRRGTGHAVSCGVSRLPGDLTGTVLVSYGDVPLLDAATMRALHGEHVDAGHAVTLLTAELDDPRGYGRVVRDAAGGVTAIVEHRDATLEQLAINEVNSGVYAFDLAFLREALGRLDTDNAQGELYLTDVVAIAAGDGLGVGAVGVSDPWLVAGVNDRVQLADLGAELNRRQLDRWMRAGVTVVAPRSTWVDVDGRLERDVTLHPGTQLHGRTTVAEGATIGPDTTLTDVAVGPRASVIRTHGSASRIGPETSVGPFAFLRPGCELEARGKIGTFVEVKNARIGEDSKVPHLTYVGDATIGEGSNIGASSVFVNYDGVTKHRTVVGSHVRTGSDNTFVAPVTVGDGAYSGAGTVIREDVPPGALAVSSGPQRNIEGWVARRRPGTAAAQAAEQAAKDAGDDQDRLDQEDP
jgi:bifunctional UDP-N-acetylglucosamine pyrophosphorylase/glucosamine-1-phosphate N-acetyltransferase